MHFSALIWYKNLLILGTYSASTIIIVHGGGDIRSCIGVNHVPSNDDNKLLNSSISRLLRVLHGRHLFFPYWAVTYARLWP